MIIIGFDWARNKHNLCVMRKNGDIIFEQVVKHDGEALNELKQRIAELEPNSASVHVALEQHDGALLAWLLDTGYTVYAINPKSADRARDIFRPAGAKDDAGDARIAADLLRNNLERYRPMYAQSDDTLHLRSLSRLQKRVTEQKTALMQQLRTLLAEWSPQLSKLCNDFNRKWQRCLIRQFPLHEDLVAAHGNKVNSVLAGHRLSKATREKVLSVRNAEPVFVPAGRKAALRTEINFIIELLDQYIEKLVVLEQDITEAFISHPCFETFNSLPVKGVSTLAAIASSFGDRRENPTGWRQLAACWGVAPVTYASGKTCSVRRRKACDSFALQAFSDFSFASSFSVTGCWASDFYERKRSEGHDHHEAIRAVGLRWVKVMWKIWHDGTIYDEQIHQKRKCQNR